MGILRALGFGLTIVILKLLLPDVMSGLENTLSALFGITGKILGHINASIPE